MHHKLIRTDAARPNVNNLRHVIQSGTRPGFHAFNLARHPTKAKTLDDNEQAKCGISAFDLLLSLSIAP
jgi:hypothetical protein